MNEENEKRCADILNSSFPPNSVTAGDGVSLTCAKHPELPTVPKYEDMTRTTRDIAEQLARKILNVLEPGELDSVIYILERELDKYFDEGTIQWGR